MKDTRFIEVAVNQLVEMVGTIPEKLNFIHPAMLAESGTVAEECESRSAPDETTLRSARDGNELRFDDLASIEDMTSNITANMSRFSAEAQLSADELTSNITANVSRFSVKAQLSADELAIALMLAVDGCKSHFSPEQKKPISPEEMAEIEEEARDQTDLLDEVFEDMQSTLFLVKHPVLEEALKSKNDLLDRLFANLEANVCEGDTGITDEESTELRLHGKVAYEESANLRLHGKTNVIYENSLFEAEGDETALQSDEEREANQQVTIRIGNTAVTVVDLTSKDSGERSCTDEENASANFSTRSTRGMDKYHARGMDKYHARGMDKYHARGMDHYRDDEKASKANTKLESLNESFAFRREISYLSLSSISNCASTKASSSVAPSMKVVGPTKMSVERESDHESASNDERRITGDSSTGGIDGTWDDERSQLSSQVITPKKRRNVISRGFKFILKRKNKIS
jgi:hypothetical protein